MAIDNFRLTQRILLVSIIEHEENRRTVLITFHPSIHLATHPSGQYRVWGFKNGRSSRLFLKIQFWFLNQINGKTVKWTRLGSLRSSLRGINFHSIMTMKCVKYHSSQNNLKLKQLLVVVTYYNRPLFKKSLESSVFT